MNLGGITPEHKNQLQLLTLRMQGKGEDFSAKDPQPEFLSQRSSANNLRPICLGSPTNLFEVECPTLQLPVYSCIQALYLATQPSIAQCTVSHYFQMSFLQTVLCLPAANK